MTGEYTLKLTSTMDDAEMTPYWPAVLEQLEDYVRMYPSHVTLTELMRKIAFGDLQLWIVLENATNKCVMSVVTHIVILNATGTGSVSVYALAGEKLAEVAPLVDDIIAWAKKHHGVQEAEITGRPGITRVLKPYGFDLEAVTLKRKV